MHERFPIEWSVPIFSAMQKISILIAFFLCTSCSFGGNSSPKVLEAPTASGGFVAPDRTILALGDSLTAGYGLSADAAYPAKLEQILLSNGYPYRVRNAGVSGDTSSTLLARTDWILSDSEIPEFVLLCIGGNDGLQGLDVNEMEKNIASVVAKIQEKNIPVVLLGMQMPANLGFQYRSRFDAVFPRVAKEKSIPFYPFLLEGIARDPEWNLPDGIHPNEKGTERIAQGIFEFLEEEALIKK